ncbi:MAG: helix-turn-helix transcriptional regulator [Janthinobacterium lividum]
MNCAELRLFGDIVARLERLGPEQNPREEILDDLMRLMRADFAVSRVYTPRIRDSSDLLYRNIDPETCRRYDLWYQDRDPITTPLRSKRRPAMVEEVIASKDFYATDFYNDLLRPEGMYYGVNLFIFDGQRDLGDFRLWRTKRSHEFEQRELSVLDALHPFMKRALITSQQTEGSLTPRERDVTRLVAKGCTDREIASLLGIGFGTVRTHLNQAMQKRNCSNRAELAALYAGRNR